MTTAAEPAEMIIHASCVSLDGRGVLILGPSGSGKSTLAIALMALGAELVSDDRTMIRRDGPGIVACAPAAIRGLIEARGVGIFRLRPAEEAAITLAVELGQDEPDRLPPRRTRNFLGSSVDLVHATQNPHFASALLLYLRHGRHA